MPGVLPEGHDLRLPPLLGIDAVPLLEVAPELQGRLADAAHQGHVLVAALLDGQFEPRVPVGPAGAAAEGVDIVLGRDGADWGELGHVFGVDAGAVAVGQVAVAHPDGADRGGEVEVEVDPGEQIEPLGGRNVGHHGPAGAHAHAQVGGSHGDELGLALHRAPGDGPAHRLLVQEQAGLAGHDRLDERLVVVVGHDGEGAAVGGDEVGAAGRGGGGRRRGLDGAGLAERRRAMVGSVPGLCVVAQEAAQHGLLSPGGVGQGLLPRTQLLG